MGDVRINVEDRPTRLSRKIVDAGLILGLLLLSVAVFSLARANADLQDRLTFANSRAVMERAELAALLTDLQSELEAANRSNVAKDAEIRRLTDLLLDAGQDPGTPVPGSEPTVRASGSQPSPVPGPTSRPSTQPSDSPQPSPTPTLTEPPCLIPNPLGGCLIPPRTGAPR